MDKFTLYLGLNDKDTKTQLVSTLEAYKVVTNVLKTYTDGATVFERLNEGDYSAWLEDFTLGELWTRNVIEGGPTHE